MVLYSSSSSSWRLVWEWADVRFWVLGVFELDGDALSVTGVERAILCLKSICSRKKTSSESECKLRKECVVGR